MKNKQAIEIIKDIAGQHNNSAEKRAFEKAVAALEYCKNLTYYIENKQFKNIWIDGFKEVILCIDMLWEMEQEDRYIIDKMGNVLCVVIRLVILILL